MIVLFVSPALSAGDGQVMASPPPAPLVLAPPPALLVLAPPPALLVLAPPPALLVLASPPAPLPPAPSLPVLLPLVEPVVLPDTLPLALPEVLLVLAPAVGRRRRRRRWWSRRYRHRSPRGRCRALPIPESASVNSFVRTSLVSTSVRWVQDRHPVLGSRPRKRGTAPPSSSRLAVRRHITRCTWQSYPRPLACGMGILAYASSPQPLAAARRPGSISRRSWKAQSALVFPGGRRRPGHGR